jgi:Bacterial protein of unknown function (DUF916)
MRHLFRFSSHGFWPKLLIALFCCGVFFAATGSVAIGSKNQSAAGEANFTLQPVAYDPSNPVTRSYFVINTNHGALLQEQVRVSNIGTATGTVKLFSVDSRTSQMGGVVYLSPTQAQLGVGSWIKLTTQALTLAPGQSQVVQFQIVVPQHVGPGQYVGGILAQSTTLQSASTSLNKTHFQVNLQRQTIIAVELNLPGPQVERLTATEIHAGGGSNYQQLLIGLKNSGNTMITGNGSLQVSDSQGHLLQDLTLNVGTFLPQTSIEYPALVQGKALGVDTYQAVLTLHYGRNHVLDHVLHYTTTFTITQQQVKQAFPSGPLQAPLTSPLLPLWAIIMLVVLGILAVGGLSGLFFWRLAVRSVTGSGSMGADRKKSKRDQKS